MSNKSTQYFGFVKSKCKKIIITANKFIIIILITGTEQGNMLLSRTFSKRTE